MKNNRSKIEQIMADIHVPEIMCIRSTCEKGYSKEEATKLMVDASNKLAKFKKDNAELLSTLAVLEAEERKWCVYVHEYQYMVGRCYKYDLSDELSDYTIYMRIKACGSGREITGQAVQVIKSSFIRSDNYFCEVWNKDSLKEISQEEFDTLWNKAEE